MQWTYLRPVLDPTQPFNDLLPEATRNNMTCWVFPADDGPLPSPGWEATREGIEDGKYAFTLETLIDRVRSGTAEGADVMAQAKAAEVFLSDIYARVDASPRKDVSEFPVARASKKLDPEFFSQFRFDAARHIAKLNGELVRLQKRDNTALVDSD